ncbi:Signal transduction histidine kinase [Chitinophaga sp. CF118]|uniref:tetratricopeptide repeat-containing sensor histidine kinase n=1 Tax=Chitinophaga sp. CF118 TaxID=1884367 RepID=UPI0008E6AD44|nr:ATP-binding protein [Chitinophaga sp. CF118]SFE02300.1 Signal transduction histidine kinase [Chitinophaga sp. CF118]
MNDWPTLPKPAIKTGKLLICILLLWQTALPQKHTNTPPHIIDSLLRAIKRAPSDASRAELMILLAKKLPARDSLLSVNYFEQAIDIYNRKKSKIGVARTYFSIGSWYNNSDNLEEAERYFLQAKDVLIKDTSKESRRLLAMTKINLATLLGNQGRTEQQVEQYLQSIPLLEKLDAPDILGNTYDNLGNIFFNKAQYKTAVTYYRKSVETYKDSPLYSYHIARRHLSLASCMYYMDSLPQMEKYLVNAKRKLDLTGADSIDLWANYYEYRGQLDVKNQLYYHATSMFNNGLSIARRYHYSHAICNNLYSLAKLYVRLGQYDQAMELMKEYAALSLTLKDFPFRLHALDLMADIAYKQHNTDEAYDFLRKYLTLSDSLQEKDVTQKLHELEARYQSSEKENRILQLQHENERQEFALQKNRLLLALMGVIMVSLVIVASLSYQFYRNGRKLLEQQQKLHAFEVERIRQEHQISLLSAMLEGQEQERTRLARDLHDGLGGLLSGIKLELSTISPAQKVSRIKILVDNTMQRLDEAMDELRRIARSMMPEILIKYGLGEATVEYCRGLKKTGVKNVVCQVFNFQTTMEHARQVVLYRIMQELVNNAVKHADAEQILVLLQQTGDTLFLTVEDDGKGFDVEAGSRLKGAGLTNIQARVDFLGGKIDIQSETGTGTTIIIECTI